MANALHEDVERATEWVDAVFALGWRAAGSSQREAGEHIAQRLEEAGLLACARALRGVFESAESDALDRMGRLCVVLETTRESLEIERLRQGGDLDPPPGAGPPADGLGNAP